MFARASRVARLLLVRALPVLATLRAALPRGVTTAFFARPVGRFFGRFLLLVRLALAHQLMADLGGT